MHLFLVKYQLDILLSLVVFIISWSDKTNSIFKKFGNPQVKIDILWIISQTINKFLLQQAQIYQKHVTSWVYTPQNRVDRYTGYIRYIGICFDTGIGDIDNSKIPIYRHFGTLLRNTGLKRYFESNLLTIVFRNQR
jgi:hypothetical protein